MKKIESYNISTFEKLKRFKFKLFYALIFYFFRYLKQKINLFYLLSIGRYGFSKIGKNVVINGIPKFIFPCSKIIICDDVKIGRNCVFQGSHDSEIYFEKNVSINDGCFITSLFKISIGENTSIGEYTSIRDYNHSYNEKGSIKNQGYFGDEIVIGKNCWIGRGCIILPGVKIGDGAVIAANSVVNKDVLPNSVVGGVPVKFIRHIK